MKLKRLIPAASSLLFAASTQLSSGENPGASYGIKTGNAAGIFTVTAGTWKLDPFFSQQGKGNASGEAYTASFPKPDSNSRRNPDRNRDLLFSDQGSASIDGAGIFSFLIDAGDSNNRRVKTSSQVARKIYTRWSEVSSLAGLTRSTKPLFDVDLPTPGSLISYSDALGGSGPRKGDFAFDFADGFEPWGRNHGSNGHFGGNSGLGDSAGGSGIAAVPEPASMASLMALLAGGAFMRNRRRSNG